MLRYSLLLLIFTADLLSSAAATPLTSARAESLRTQFQNRQRETKTWSATFTQTVSMPGMRQPVISTGNLAYQAPSRLSLAFEQPAGDSVLIVEDQLFVQKAGRKPSLKSLSRDNAGKPFLSLLSLLRGQPADDESAFEPQVSKEKDSYLVVLQRKDGSSSRLPRRITNTVDAETLEIREVLVELPNGGTLSYRFDRIVRNRPIEPSRFIPPASQ